MPVSSRACGLARLANRLANQAIVQFEEAGESETLQVAFPDITVQEGG